MDDYKLLVETIIETIITKNLYILYDVVTLITLLINTNELTLSQHFNTSANIVTASYKELIYI